MKTRTDCHRPSAINPEDYDFVALGYQRDDLDVGACYVIAENRRIFQAHQARTGAKWSRHQHGGNCHICGAYCIYDVVFYHRPTNTYIRTGMDCAAKLEMGDERDFRAFKQGIKSALECKAGKNKAKALLADAELLSAWALYENRQDIPRTHTECRELGMHSDAVRAMLLTVDIVDSVVRYGHLTDKQIAFLKKLEQEIADAPRIAREKEAAKKAKRHVGTEGKRECFELTFHKALEFDGAYGISVLVLFSDDDGNSLIWWTNWSAFPGDLEQGGKYRIKATVKRHGTHDGAPQTVLTRCKLEEILAQPLESDAKWRYVPEEKEATA